jgi:hypothetical protein
MTVINTVLDTSDTVVGVIDGGSQPINNVNAAAQLAAIGASFGIPTATPVQAAAIVTIDEAAISTGMAAFAADIHADNTQSAIGDAFSIFGDVINATAVMASQQGPAGRALALDILAWGDGIDLLGLGIKNGSDVIMGVPIAVGELQTEIKQASADLSQSGTTATPFFVSVNGNAGNAWGAVETGLLNALNNIELGASLTGSAFTSVATAAYSDFRGAETGSLGLFTSTGLVAESTTDTVTGDNAYSLSGSGYSGTSGTENISGNSTNTTATGNNGGFNVTQNDSFTSGSMTETTQCTTSDGSLMYTQSITTPSTGQITASISGQGDVATLSNVAIAVAAGTQASINGANNVVTAAANAAITLAGTDNVLTLSPGDTAYDSAADFSSDTLAFVTSGGNQLTIDPSTIVDTTQYADSATLTFTLVDSGLVSLGTLTFNTTTNADSLTLTDGLVLNLPGITSNVVAAAPVGSTPEQTLLAYLADLGDPTTASALSTLDYNYLNPAGTRHTETPYQVIPIDNNTAADVYYSGGTPGAVIAGQSTVTITVNGVPTQVPAYNIITAGDQDLARDTISGIQELVASDGVGAVAFTAAQWSHYSLITGSGALIAANGGAPQGLLHGRR